jgi:phospholipid/cholesterol/gamma-HCH transport system permease protein
MTHRTKILLMPAALLGRRAREGLRFLAMVSVFVYLPLRRTLFPPYHGFAALGRTTIMQIYFTGVQALPLFLFLSFLMGISASLAVRTTVGIQAVLCNFILKEMAPFLVALIVLGRSGTAITVELGNMTVLGEIKQLRRMGIDPFRHIVFPRLVGVIVSACILSVFFEISLALLTAFFSPQPFYIFLEQLLKYWTVRHVWILLELNFLFGLIIAAVSCYQGLCLKPATTEVPKATIRTVIQSIMLCATLGVLFKFLLL